MDTDVDPFGSDTLMLTYSNANSDLFAKRLVLTAGPTFNWTDADGGAAISAALSTTGGITTQNFDFEYDQKFPCNAVTPTGLAAGTLTPTSVPLTWTTTQEIITTGYIVTAFRSAQTERSRQDLIRTIPHQ